MGTRPPYNLSTAFAFQPEVESRTQGSRPRPRTQKNIRGQGQPFRGQTLSRPRTGMLKDTSASALQKKKRSSQKFFKRSSQKNVFQTIFQALHKILTIQKIVLSSRPRTSKCVLEAKDVLEDSISASNHLTRVQFAHGLRTRGMEVYEV